MGDRQTNRTDHLERGATGECSFLFCQPSVHRPNLWRTMVYCGKASQGCQNCRTRRIKVCNANLILTPFLHPSPFVQATVPVLLASSSIHCRLCMLRLACSHPLPLFFKALSICILEYPGGPSSVGGIPTTLVLSSSPCLTMPALSIYQTTLPFLMSSLLRVSLPRRQANPASQCDKVRPECSQCLRVHKKCPGYRDQLSLMFRG